MRQFISDHIAIAILVGLIGYSFGIKTAVGIISTVALHVSITYILNRDKK